MSPRVPQLREAEVRTSAGNEGPKPHMVGAGVALGVSIGAAMGVALDSITLGTGVGVAVGLALGMVLSHLPASHRRC